MKFEELESLWTAQPSVVPLVVEAAEIKRNLQPEMRRRSRMLAYELGTAVLALLALPVLSVANYLYDPARYGTVPQGLHVVGQLGVIALYLRHAWRRFSRHRALQRRPVGSLREMALVSLANVEAEMRDYRWQQPVLWLLAASMSFAIVRSGLLHGWKTGLFAGLATAGLLAMVGAVLWRHYVANLRPARARQKELLRGLE